MSAPLQPTLPPHCDPVVVAIITQLQEQIDLGSRQIAAQTKKIEADAKELEYARLKIQVLGVSRTRA